MTISEELNPLLPPSTWRRGVWVPSGFHLLLLMALLDPITCEGRPDDTSWPTWDYVVRSLRRNPTFYEGGKAPGDLWAELPRINNGTRTGYGFTWRTNSGGGPLQPSEHVGLTIAGLRMAEPLRVDYVVRLATSFAADEDQLPLTSSGVARGFASFNTRAQRMLATGPLRMGRTYMTVRAAALLFQHEHPPLISDEGPPGQWIARLGERNYSDLTGITTTTQYLTKLWTDLAPINQELIPNMQIMRQQQQTVTLIHAEDTPQETQKSVRGVIQAEHGFFDVKTQIYEGDIVEFSDPRGFVDRRLVAKLEMNSATPAIAHIVVQWGPVPTIRTPGRETPTHAKKQIFLVHGRDNATKETIARFIERALHDTDAVTILHEQPNSGRTIIEKFEHHAGQSGYAVVLLTPDDEGGPKSGEIKPRARQNVIFELGYLAGALGRDRMMQSEAFVEL